MSPVASSGLSVVRMLHTSAVQFFGWVWRMWLPVFVVASSALILVVAIRSRERSRVWSRARVALAVLVWLRLVDKAALGDRRPVFERQRKGTAAILLAAGGRLDGATRAR